MCHSAALALRSPPRLSRCRSFAVNQDNGAQIRFKELGSAPGQIDADGCKTTSSTVPGGDYTDPQKYTLPTSAIQFCGPRRLDAQLGYFPQSGGVYKLQSQGGKTFEIFNSSGQLIDRGDVENPTAIAYSYTAKPATHTMCPHDTEAQCEVETDQPSSTRVVAEFNAAGMVEQMWDPRGMGYEFASTSTTHRLAYAAIQTNQRTTYAYTTTSTNGLDDELTSVTTWTKWNTGSPESTVIAYTKGMVTRLTDPVGDATTFSYSDTKCATSTTCVKGVQATTVNYTNGQHDKVTYTRGLLASDCYGGTSSNPCAAPSSQWTFTYKVVKTRPQTKAYGDMTETVKHGSTVATITFDQAGNVSTYTAPDGLTTREMYNDTGGNNLEELCWVANPTVGVSASASCTAPPAGSTHCVHGGGPTERDRSARPSRRVVGERRNRVSFVQRPLREQRDQRCALRHDSPSKRGVHGSYPEEDMGDPCGDYGGPRRGVPLAYHRGSCRHGGRPYLRRFRRGRLGCSCSG